MCRCLLLLLLFTVSGLCDVSTPVAVSESSLSDPYIIQHPQHQLVNRLSSVTLECRATGNPTPVITWYRDGQPLTTGSVNSSSPRIVLESGQLVLRKVTHGKGHKGSDAGEYYCNASNPVSGVSVISQIARVDIAEKPAIVQGPKDTIVPENSDVQLQCLVTGEPQPVIVWKKDEGQIPAERSQILENQSLKIKGTRPFDEGVYICRAENSLGWQEAEAKLTVLTQPSFLIAPISKKVSLGRKVSIRCVVAGNPKPTVFWNQLSTQTLFFPGNSGGRIYVSVDGTLTVESMHYEDSGEYSCQALNSAGSSFANARITVTESDVRPPPIIYQGAQNQTLPVETKAVLPCLASGEPEPSILWLKENQPLSGHEPRIHITDSGTLEITDLKQSDTGVYTCLAISECGESSWTAGLVVELPSNPSIVFHCTPESSTFPGAPSRPVVSDITESSLRLSWRQNENNGASPVHSYIVEYFSQNSDRGWIVASNSVSEPHYVIHNLLPNASYMFLVRAQNSHGVSLPSPLSVIVKTKEMHSAGALSDDIRYASGSVSHVAVVLHHAEVYNSTTVTLHWQISPFDHTIDGYHIKYSDDLKTSVLTLMEPSATTFVLSNLKKSTWYEVSVQPFCGMAIGKTSNIVRVFTSSQEGDYHVTKSVVVNEPWFIATLITLVTGTILCAVCILTFCICKRRDFWRKTSKAYINSQAINPQTQTNASAHVQLLSANEKMAVGYQPTVGNQSSDPNSVQFNCIYHTLDSTVEQQQQQQQHRRLSSTVESPYATTFIDDTHTAATIPNPLAYMIHRSNYADSGPRTLPYKHTSSREYC